MRKPVSLALALGLSTALASCGVTPSPGVGRGGEVPVVAVPFDSGFDRRTLVQQRAAIAYDPDGCQNWLIDHGFEGYASRRRDPVSGLPICNDRFPPGTIVKDYMQQGGPGDWVPAGQPRRVIR
jgi:hypothetical protein